MGPTATPNPNLIKRGPDVDFPDNMAMIIEKGCWGCDGGAGSIVRVYRDASGTVRIEELFTALQDSLPKRVNDSESGPAEYAPPWSSHAVSNDASVMAVAFCLQGACGFGGEFSPFDADSVSAIFRSLDGGITWNEIGPGGPVYAVTGVLADGRVLVSNSQEDSGPATYFLLPDNTPVHPPAEGVYPVTSSDEILWSTNDGRLLLSDGREFFRAPADSYAYYRSVLGTFSGLDKGSALVYWELPVPTPRPDDYRDQFGVALLDIGAGQARIARQWEIDSWVASVGWLSPAKDDDRIVVSVADISAQSYGFPVPAIVDLDTGPLNLIPNPFTSDEPPYNPFGRTYVLAVQTGPFARVTGTGSCLNLRAEPSLTAEVFTCAADGVLLPSSGLSQSAEGLEWVSVMTSREPVRASAAYLER